MLLVKLSFYNIEKTIWPSGHTVGDTPNLIWKVSLSLKFFSPMLTPAPHGFVEQGIKFANVKS